MKEKKDILGKVSPPPKQVAQKPQVKAKPKPKPPAKVRPTAVPHVATFKLRIEIPVDALSPGDAVDKAWNSVNQVLHANLPCGASHSLAKPGHARRVTE